MKTWTQRLRERSIPEIAEEIRQTSNQITDLQRNLAWMQDILNDKRKGTDGQQADQEQTERETA